tara:strand:- start:185 stop:577 length:393 start_codon:yes stop_codon:yes gene_type:complete
MSLFDDISVFEKGTACSKCRKKFYSWVGYRRHTAKCVNAFSLGISYTYFLSLAALAVVTLLYVLMSIPVNWVYDIIVNTWILSNPAVFSTERLEAYNWMMSMWALLPVVILLSMITFAITRTLRERTPGY